MKIKYTKKIIIGKKQNEKNSRTFFEIEETFYSYSLLTFSHSWIRREEMIKENSIEKYSLDAKNVRDQQS